MNPLLIALSAIQNPHSRALVKKAFESAGHRVVESNGWKQAQLLLTNGFAPDLLLVDCPHLDSMAEEHFRELWRCGPPSRMCLVTEANEPGIRLEATQLGIKHILKLPVTPCDLRAIACELHYSTKCLDVDEHSCPSSTSSAVVVEDIVSPIPYIEELGEASFFLAASPKMLEIHRQIELLSDSDVNVLVLGESGTGKEVIARLIHKHSQRNKKRFLKVNCAALPADLLESELFGHRQGAFTGAIKDMPGKFEQAGGGTLFLDEIGEISVQLQAKLLHVLEDGEFSRLGAQQYTKVDARVIAATNVQMDKALSERIFREDLYYRLSVITITIPPLRERPEDIPYLIEETIRRTPAEMRNGGTISFTARLLDAALLYEWPGNVRELRNFVTRTTIMQDSDAALRQLEMKITPAKKDVDRSPFRDGCSGGASMKSVVRDIKERTEAKLIQGALEETGWNRRHAARSLNISYRALLYKIQQHRLTPPGADNTNGDSNRNCSVRSAG